MTDLTKGNFKFFMGVVEDRLDPEHKGRVRVRCYGIHTADKSQIPTNALPWAKVSVPCSNPRNSSTNIIEGTQVFGVFGDGAEMQKPIVLHIIPSTFGSGSPLVGFNDPRTINAISKTDALSVPYNLGARTPWMNEYSDTRRYSSSLGSKKTQAFAPDAYESVMLEFPNPYAAIYPYNNASETESGHAIELDDTPGSERVHIFHRSGSFIEMHPDGSTVIKSVSSNNSVVLKDNLIIINGNENKAVDGSCADRVGGDRTTRIDGDYSSLVIGDSGTKVEGDHKETFLGDYDSKVEGDRKDTVLGNFKLEVVGDRKDTVLGNFKLEVVGDVDINVLGGNVNLTVVGNVSEKIIGNVERTVVGNLVENISGNIVRTVGGNVIEVLTGPYVCAAPVVYMPLPIQPI